MAARMECLGPFCAEAGIKEDDLFAKRTLSKLSTPLMKGTLYELNKFRVEHGFSWDDLYKWLTDLSCGQLPSVVGVKCAISRLVSKRSRLSRNKGDIESFFRERAFRSDSMPLSACEPEVLPVTEDPKEAALKASSAIVHNISRKLKRRDDKMLALTTENTLMSKEVRKLKKQVDSTKQVKQRSYKSASRASKKIEDISDENANLQAKLDEMEETFSQEIEGLKLQVGKLTEMLQQARLERDGLSSRVNDLESHTFVTKKHNRRYMDGVRQCCMELLSRNVGVSQVEPVIRSVLSNICSIDVIDLPKW